MSRALFFISIEIALVPCFERSKYENCLDLFIYTVPSSTRKLSNHSVDELLNLVISQMISYIGNVSNIDHKLMK
jgi:hypothetical protein